MVSPKRALLNWARQFAFVSATVLASWLGMQAVHELGHMSGAWLTGGRVEQVVLHPLTISRTDLAANPHPLAVAWAGPIVGTALPVLPWITVFCVAKTPLPRVTWFFQFFAGFCLIANGLYIGLGSFGAIGDCGDMLRHGSAIWQLWLFGLVATPLGLFLWHGLGPRFGGRL